MAVCYEEVLLRSRATSTVGNQAAGPKRRTAGLWVGQLRVSAASNGKQLWHPLTQELYRMGTHGRAAEDR